MALARRERQSMDIWPGFVDALATLLMVIIFLLMIFFLSQIFLNEALSGRDDALQRLNNQVSELSELLTLERTTNTDMRENIAQLSSELRASLSQRDELATELRGLRTLRDSLTTRLADAQEKADTLSAERDRLATEREDLLQTRDALSLQVEEAYKVIEADKETIEMQVAELAQLSNDVAALEALKTELVDELKNVKLDFEARGALLDEARALLGETESKLAETDQALASSEAKLALRDSEIAEIRAILADRQKDLDETEALLASRGSDLESSKTLLDRRQRDLDKSREQLALTKEELDQKIEALLLARGETARLNRAVAALREQLEILNATLDASEERDREQKAQIEALGQRLNTALASKVQELARYRSDFFGKLREILGDRRDIQVVGDRFVFQSEVLFQSGSADLEDAGKEQMAQLAATLLELAEGIPSDINWVLRVDGHTDRNPISTDRFPSNWELSTARAISVVKFLNSQGIPAGRLAAAGFAEFQPLDPREDEIGFRRNRRIELKLDQR